MSCLTWIIFCVHSVEQVCKAAIKSENHKSGSECLDKQIDISRQANRQINHSIASEKRHGSDKVEHRWYGFPKLSDCVIGMKVIDALVLQANW